jgi:hypothetical protein
MSASELDFGRFLPARSHTALVPHHLAAVSTAEDSRRFVAVVSQERRLLAGLKYERRGLFSTRLVAKILNESNEAVSCTLSGWTLRGMKPIAPAHFWISPQSIAQIPIQVPLRLPFLLRTVSIHMQTQTLRASAEADVPVPVAVSAGKIFACIAAIGIALASTWQAMRPKIAAYALPQHAVAGDRVTASYALAGSGNAHFSVRSLGGEEVASGYLDRRSGEFSFPTYRRTATYRVSLIDTGAFGTARRTLNVSALPVIAMQSTGIDALQPEPSVVQSGAKVDVRYIADADSGRVTLYDTAGIPLARAPYSDAGMSTLVAPNVIIPTQYRVELQVNRGTKTSVASAGLLVLPKPSNPKRRTADPKPLPVPAASSMLRIDPTFVMSTTSFAVRLLAHPRQLRLTLEDDHGTPIATTMVSKHQPFVEFRAPYVNQNRTFVVVESYARGAEQQVLLQPLVIHP